MGKWKETKMVYSQTCGDYCGCACVNGSCPNIPELEGGMGMHIECEECWLNRGCVDCVMPAIGFCKR